MRSLNPSTISMLKSHTVRLEYLYVGEFKNSTLRLWTGIGDLSHDGHIWLGNGWLQSPGQFSSSTEVRAYGASVQLSGLSIDVVYLLLNEVQQKNTGTVYVAALDSDESIIETIQLFTGYTDKVEITEKDSGSTAVISYESPLIRLTNAREKRWTDQAQQADYTGDRGFEYMSYLQQQRVYWGQPDPRRQT